MSGDNLRSGFGESLSEDWHAATLHDRLQAEEMYEDPETWSPAYRRWHDERMAKR